MYTQRTWLWTRAAERGVNEVQGKLFILIQTYYLTLKYCKIMARKFQSLVFAHSLTHTYIYLFMV